MNKQNEQYSAGMQALANLLKYIFLFLSFSIAILVIWYILFAGYFIVRPQERAILLRFGKIVGEYREGWHWAYPYPISKVIKIPTTKQNIKTSSFWFKTDLKAFTEGRTDEIAGKPLNPAVDGYLITGDANIIHTEWVLVYEINDPIKYYTKFLTADNPATDDPIVQHPDSRKNLGTRGAKTTLKALLDQTILKTTAKWKVDHALYKNSTDYNREVLAEFVKELANLDCGINLDTIEINLTAKTPPIKVIKAFQNVIEAEQEMSKEIQNAKEYAVKINNEAEAEKANIIAQANLYKNKVVSQIEAEEAYFKKILAEYKKSPDSILIALYNDAISNFLLKVKDKYLIPIDQADKQEIRIMLNPEPPIQKKDENKEQK